MLVIVLYYVNLIKWTSNTYEKFLSFEKPELSLESIINFNKDEASVENSDQKSSIEQSSNKQQSQLSSLNSFLVTNHSSHSSLSDSSSDFSTDNEINSEESSILFFESNELNQNNQLNSSETNSRINLNKLNFKINSTKVTSLQSSSFKITDYSIFSTQNDLSPNKQLDQISLQNNSNNNSSKTIQQNDVKLQDSDQQEQKISTVHFIQVLSSKHKVELKIDNQIVSFNFLFFSFFFCSTLFLF